MGQKVVVDYSLNELLNLFKKEVFLDLNAHAVGSIESFNQLTQTADVSIVYSRTVNDKPIPYPLFKQVPCIILGGGSAHIEMPITSGDNCLLLFNDRDFDDWYVSGQNNFPPASDALHSFSHAFAIVGIRSLLKSIINYDMSHASIRNGVARVGVGVTSVLIENALFTLGGLMSDLMTILQGLTTTPTVPGVPAAVNPATIAQLAALKIKYGILLE